MTDLDADVPPSDLGPLAYASGDGSIGLRPLLWLVLMIPVGSLLADAGRYVTWGYAYVFGYAPTAFRPADWVGLATEAGKCAIEVGVVVLAASALRTRRLGVLPAACVGLAVVYVVATVIGTSITLVQISGSPVLPAWYWWQTIVSGVVTAVASTVLPVTAFLGLRWAGRRLPRV